MGCRIIHWATTGTLSLMGDREKVVVTTDVPFTLTIRDHSLNLKGAHIGRYDGDRSGLMNQRTTHSFLFLQTARSFTPSAKRLPKPGSVDRNKQMTIQVTVATINLHNRADRWKERRHLLDRTDYRSSPRPDQFAGSHRCRFVRGSLGLQAGELPAQRLGKTPIPAAAEMGPESAEQCH